MSESNLSVKITADTTSFTAAMAVSKAALNDRTAALREAIKAETSFGTANIAAAQAVQQAAENVARAQAQVRALNEQLKATRTVSTGLGGGLEELRAGMSKAFAVTGITAAAAAVMEVGRAIDVLGDRAIEIKTMSSVLGVTTSQFQAMSVASEESGVSVQVFARASEHLTNLLSEARDGSGKAVEKLHALGITTADVANKNFQLNDVLAVLKKRLEDTSTVEQTRKALLQDLGARTALAIQAIKEYDGSERGVAEAMARVNGQSDEQLDRLKKMKTWWSELGDTASNRASLVVAAFGNVLDAYKKQVLLMHPDMNPALTTSGPGRDASSTGEARAAEQSARAQEAIHSEVLHSEMESVREGVAAFAQGTAERLAALQRYASLAKQYYGSANVDEVRKADREVIAEERAFREAQGREAIAAVHAQNQSLVADTSLSTVQRLEAERDNWAKLLSSDQVSGAARVQVARDFARTYAEIAKESQAQINAIARSDANTDIAISKIELDAKRSQLDQEVAANQIAAAQKRDILRQLAAEEFAANVRGLNDELKGLQEGTLKYVEVYNQIRELKAKLVAELEKLDDGYQKDLAKQLKQQEALWRSAVGEIESIEGSLVSDVLTKRKGLSQSLIQISGELVTKEIQNDIKAFTTKMLLHDQDKALEQGGLLFHAAVALQKMLTTQQSEAAQTAANVAGNTARLSSDATAAMAEKAISRTTGSSTVLADAAKAYSGTYASVAQIPYVGWALAPAAAAAAYAAVAAYEGLASLDVGTNYVTQDMVAQIHKGEAIVPKAYNPAAGGAGASSGSDMHLHVKMNDARGLAGSLRRGGLLERELRNLHRQLAR